MRQRSWLGTLGALLLASFGSCTNEPVFNAAVIDGNFVAPVAEFDPVLDAALWDDTSYDAVVVTPVVAQVTAVPTTTPRLPRPIGPLLASFGAVIPSSCIPTVTFTDADQDGIPLSYDATFNCVGVPAGTSRVTGRVTIADNDDSSATGGLTVAFSSFVIAVGTSAGAVGRTLDGTMTLVPGPSGTFTGTQNLTTTFPSADPSTVGALGTYVSKETATYTPTSAVDPFSSGTVNLGGSGKLTATFNGEKQNKDVSRSSNPLLHWNRSCRTQFKGSIGYDSGTLIYSIGGDGKLELLFSGCVAPVQAVAKN